MVKIEELALNWLKRRKIAVLSIEKVNNSKFRELKVKTTDRVFYFHVGIGGLKIEEVTNIRPFNAFDRRGGQMVLYWEDDENIPSCVCFHCKDDDFDIEYTIQTCTAIPAGVPERDEKYREEALAIFYEEDHHQRLQSICFGYPMPTTPDEAEQMYSDKSAHQGFDWVVESMDLWGF